MTATTRPGKPATHQVTVRVPDRIPLTTLQQFLRSLGMPTDDLRELTISPRGVYVEVYAHRDGQRYIDQGTGQAALHRISIPLDRTA